MINRNSPNQTEAGTLPENEASPAPAAVPDSDAAQSQADSSAAVQKEINDQAAAKPEGWEYRQLLKISILKNFDAVLDDLQLTKAYIIRTLSISKQSLYSVINDKLHKDSSVLKNDTFILALLCVIDYRVQELLYNQTKVNPSRKLFNNMLNVLKDEKQQLFIQECGLDSEVQYHFQTVLERNVKTLDKKPKFISTVSLWLDSYQENINNLIADDLWEGTKSDRDILKMKYVFMDLRFLSMIDFTKDVFFWPYLSRMLKGSIKAVVIGLDQLQNLQKACEDYLVNLKAIGPGKDAFRLKILKEKLHSKMADFNCDDRPRDYGTAQDMSSENDKAFVSYSQYRMALRLIREDRYNCFFVLRNLAVLSRLGLLYTADKAASESETDYSGLLQGMPQGIKNVSSETVSEANALLKNLLKGQMRRFKRSSWNCSSQALFVDSLPKVKYNYFYIFTALNADSLPISQQNDVKRQVPYCYIHAMQKSGKDLFVFGVYAAPDGNVWGEKAQKGIYLCKADGGLKALFNSRLNSVYIKDTTTLLADGGSAEFKRLNPRYIEPARTELDLLPKVNYDIIPSENHQFVPVTYRDPDTQAPALQKNSIEPLMNP